MRIYLKTLKSNLCSVSCRNSLKKYASLNKSPRNSLSSQFSSRPFGCHTVVQALANTNTNYHSKHQIRRCSIQPPRAGFITCSYPFPRSICLVIGRSQWSGWSCSQSRSPLRPVFLWQPPYWFHSLVIIYFLPYQNFCEDLSLKQSLLVAPLNPLLHDVYLGPSHCTITSSSPISCSSGVCSKLTGWTLHWTDRLSNPAAPAEQKNPILHCTLCQQL